MNVSKSVATCPSSKLSAFPKPTSPDTVPVSSFHPPERILVNIILLTFMIIIPATWFLLHIPNTVPVTYSHQLSWPPSISNINVNLHGLLLFLCKALTNHVPLGHILVELLPIVVAGKKRVLNYYFCHHRLQIEKVLDATQ